MTTRTVTGTIYHSDGTPYSAGTVKFSPISHLLEAGGMWERDEKIVTAGTDGTFSVALAVPASGSRRYFVTLPTAKYEFDISAGASIGLDTLIGSSTAVPVNAVQALFNTHLAQADPHALYTNMPRLSDRLEGAAFPTAQPDPYLFRDLFITDLAAGDIDGTTAEPGPAARVVTDTESKLTISDGKLVCAGGKNTPEFEDPAFGEEQIIYRQPGRCLMWSMLSSGATPTALVGLYDDVGKGSNFNHGVQFGDGNTTLYYRMSVAPYYLGVAVLAASTEYTFALVQRSAGAFLFVKGGTFTSWTLVWVDPIGAHYNKITSALYSFSGYITPFKIIDLPEPFNDDYAIATSFLPGARAESDTFTHTADCLVEFTLATLPASGTLAVDFRKQDDDNKWQIAVTGTSLVLNEIVSGEVTARSSPITVGAGNRVVVSASGQVIMVMVANYLVVYYGSAINFATETDGELSGLGTGGAISNIIAWPSTYGAGALPTGTRGIQVADVVDVEDYGADPTGTVDSTNAIQAAIWGGSYVKFVTAGTYLLSRALVIPDNRVIMGAVDDVILQKTVTYSTVFRNVLASSGDFRTRNNNIILQKLTIDLNSLHGDTDRPRSNMWSHIAFCNANYVTVKDLTIINGPANAYGLHFAECSNVVVTGYSYTGLKDGFHISGGVDNLLLDGFTIDSGDDTIAILASEWTYTGPTAHDIRNIIIRNGTSDCGTAPGFLIRFITGSWLPWKSGSTYSIGHICTYGGRLYKRITAGSSASTVPPTHPWGDMTGSDGIQWRWMGDGSFLFSNIYNVSLHDVTLLDDRTIVRMVEATDDHHSEYTGTEGTSVVDNFHTDLAATIVTNQGGVFSNAVYDED